ncbi:MAG TPA: hypothetical protein VFN57_15245 [Thermomicrobiaceae bacterium]|nr:hypothetical protein [Thermomicrobiaceae bacterium]
MWFTSRDVTQRLNAGARGLGLADGATDFANPGMIGRTLNTLRIKAVQGRTAQRTREREITLTVACKVLSANLPEAVRVGDPLP